MIIHILVTIMSGFMRKELDIKLEKRKLEENFQPICTWQIILEIRDMILFIIAMDYLTPFLSLLKRLHENGCTIVVEIPTYPYDREKQSGLLWDILFKIDKIYRVKMNGVVDRIYTYSEDNQIWGIPTICSSNGIDFDLVSIRKVEKKRESINLIAVAGLAKWHGYDRILRGMGEYYKEGEKRECSFI